MVFNDILSDFPALKRYNYLSTASIGLVPNPVIEILKEHIITLSEGGTAAFDEELEVLVYDNLRDAGSKLFQCNPDDIAVFNGVSEAMNIIAWSLELNAGKIVSTVVEHPTVTYPWLRIASKPAINVELVQADNWCIDIDTLLDKIDTQTKIVVISHVEYLSGQRFDLARIAKHTHDVGALLVVDGIQAAGYTPLNLEKWNVDVYITGSYKWLCAPFGSSIAYISKDLAEKITPAFVGWRTPEDMWNFDGVNLTYAPTARKFEYGTSGYAIKFGLTESIQYMLKLGIQNIDTHNKKLVNQLISDLTAINGVDIIAPSTRGSIVAFRIKDKPVQEVGQRLRKLERPVEMSVRQNMIRIALHFYNTEADVIHLVDNIKQILAVI